MGEVWIARHRTLDVDVVIKFMAPHLADDASSRARFGREAMAAARVKSPHVVQVLDAGVSTDGRPYIVMEMLEGEDLRERLQRVGTLALPDVVTIVTQVGGALARAHERDIVHRDIKPGNVFLCEGQGAEPYAKVLDFGIARLPARAVGDSSTETGTVVGTPAYMSPEQLVGIRTLDRRADLWALAALAYRALTGAPPFAGETVGAVAMAISSTRPVAPSSLDPSVPAALDAWCERAFARAIDDRFSSADEMVAALRAAAGAGAAASKEADTLAASSTRGSALRHAPPPAWRTRAIVASAIVSAGLVAALVVAARSGGARAGAVTSASAAASAAASGSALGPALAVSLAALREPASTSTPLPPVASASASATPIAAPPAARPPPALRPRPSPCATPEVTPLEKDIR
jgi:serine/threonine-protein kinase